MSIKTVNREIKNKIERDEEQDPKLSLGPLLYNWSLDERRNFYFKIADETSIDIVYLGEVVCPKRIPLWFEIIPEITDRLKKAGKEVVFSSLSLLRTQDESDELQHIIQSTDNLMEANDIAAINLLAGKPHAIGPYVNIYNELALAFHVERGAIRVTLPSELPLSTIELLARKNLADIELQVFGRQPLAISARCAHARAYKIFKRNCQFICDKDPDGLDVFTLDNQAFLTINGLQTQSHTYSNLINELPDLIHSGVNIFRISPQRGDMCKAIEVFRDRLNKKEGAEESCRKLEELFSEATFSNGFLHGTAGHQYIFPTNEF